MVAYGMTAMFGASETETILTDEVAAWLRLTMATTASFPKTCVIIPSWYPPIVVRWIYTIGERENVQRASTVEEEYGLLQLFLRVGAYVTYRHKFLLVHFVHTPPYKMRTGVFLKLRYRIGKQMKISRERQKQQKEDNRGRKPVSPLL